MLPAGALATFALAAGLLTVTPGLDTALVLRAAAVEGPRRGLLAGLGINLGCLVWGAAAGAGLGALLALSHLAYDLLRFAGAAYLAYLGLGMILRPGRAALVETPGRTGGLGPFGRGLLTNLLNPKVGAFYISFLPQFIPPGMSPLVPSLEMALVHDAEGLLWCCLLVSATRPLARILRQPRVTAALDRVTGGVLLLFGAKLALSPRA